MQTEYEKIRDLEIQDGINAVLECGRWLKDVSVSSESLLDRVAAETTLNEMLWGEEGSEEIEELCVRWLERKAEKETAESDLAKVALEFFHN